MKSLTIVAIVSLWASLHTDKIQKETAVAPTCSELSYGSAMGSVMVGLGGNQYRYIDPIQKEDERSQKNLDKLLQSGDCGYPMSDLLGINSVDTILGSDGSKLQDRRLLDQKK